MSINVFDLDKDELLDFEDYLLLMRCHNMAKHYSMIEGNTSTEEELFIALYETEKYNERKYLESDLLLNYTDEIIEIEELDEGLMYDISVAGDQLFYANGILTKNSAGLPATCDFLLAAIETEELVQMGQQLMKQIKSRYGDKNINNKFNLVVKKGNQRWVEIDSDHIEAASTQATASSEETKKNIASRNKARNTRADLDKLAEGIKFT